MTTRTFLLLSLVIIGTVQFSCRAENETLPGTSFIKNIVVATIRETLAISGKITVEIAKNVIRFLIEQTKSTGKVTLLCGALLAGLGSIFLLKTIMSSFRKIAIGSLCVFVGIAIIVLGNKVDEPKKANVSI